MEPWIVPGGVLLLAVLLGIVTERIAVRRLEGLSKRTSNRLDDILVASFRGAWTLWFLLGGLVLGGRLAPLPEDARSLVGKLGSAGFLISITLALSRFIDLWLQDQQSLAGVGGGAARPSVVRYVVRVLVMLGGAVLVLDNLGVEVTALLTALGVGSIAVALAIQPTLSNLFAGIHLSVARPIRVGDFVELDDGTQGFITDIGWRATRVRMLANNIMIVPNAKLADMVIRNYALPEPEQSIVVQMGVAYDADLDLVENVTIGVARSIQREVDGAVPDFEPFVRYHTFGDSAVLFSVILRVRTFVDRYLALHEFHKRIHVAYAKVGIEIPFPQRVVHVSPGSEIEQDNPQREGPGR
jgi:small-conductance mechanosensitive channel